MKKEDFNKILKDINLSRQDFADMTNLTYGAVSNWDDEKKPIPGWVESWLNNYIKAKDMDKVVEAVKPHIK
jgi:DNA-binding transcriptional regulator YiaG